jgi:two-component system, LytTR family, response regulator
MITEPENRPGGSRRRYPPNNSILYQHAADIMYLKGEGCYSKAYMRDSSCQIITKTLKKCEKILDIKSFIRCHKKYLVNIQHLTSKDLFRKNSLAMNDMNNVPISRRKRSMINRFLKGRGKNGIEKK